MSADESKPGEGAATPGTMPVRRPFAFGARVPRRVLGAPAPKRIPTGQRSAGRSGGWGRIAEDSDDAHVLPKTAEDSQEKTDLVSDEDLADLPSNTSSEVTLTDAGAGMPYSGSLVRGRNGAFGRTVKPPKTALRATSVDSDSANQTMPGERVGKASHHGLTVIRPRHVGRYNLVEEIGRGGLGVIHLAHDETLRRDLAIKVLRNPHNPKHRESFVEEAQITGQLEHPNVVPVHELGFDERGGPYLAMKRVRGHSLRELIEKQKKRHRPPMQSELVRSLDIFRKVCNAIAFAHDHGVIHRDLKPENIMVGEYGEVMVMDWGLAKPLRDGPGYRGFTGNRTAVRAMESVYTDRREDKGMYLTAIGQLMGTPAYMAPEQARGASEEVDRRTDIFALGGLLYHMLTNEPPYLGTALTEVLLAASKAEVVPPRRRAPQMRIPKELEAVVMKAMAREPRNRYRSVSDLRDDIDAFLSNEPLRAYRDNWFESLAKWGRRHPTRMTLWGMSVLFVTMVMVALFAVRELQDSGKQRDRAHELAQAHAEASLAEVQRREAEVRERAAAEAAERARLEGAAEEARIRDLAQQGQIEMLLRELVGEGASENELTVQEFRIRVRSARNLGMKERRVVANLDQEQRRRYHNALKSYLAHAAEPAEQDDRERLAELNYFFALLLAYSPEASLDEAVEVLSGAIREDESQARYWYERGRLHRMLGNDDAAEADWRMAVFTDSDFVSAHLALGRLALEESRWREAAERFGRVLEVERSNVVALAGRGYALVQLGEAETGQSLLDRVHEIEPRSPELFLYRAILKFEQDDLVAALPLATAAITLEPSDPQAYLVRGSILRAQGAFDRALVDLTNAVRLDPYRTRTVFARALLHVERGETEAALIDFAETLSRNENHLGAIIERAFLRVQRDEFAEALTDATHATELAPQDWRAWLAKAEATANLGDTVAARQAYDNALRYATTPEAIARVEASSAAWLE